MVIKKGGDFLSGIPNGDSALLPHTDGLLGTGSEHLGANVSLDPDPRESGIQGPEGALEASRSLPIRAPVPTEISAQMVLSCVPLPAEMGTSLPPGGPIC